MVKSRKDIKAPGTDAHYRHQEEFLRYLHLTESVQRDLQLDVDELRSQENWNDDLSQGVQEWVNDTNAIWRLLRRHRYDEVKTHAALLTGLAKRISLNLHRPIPSIPPYSDSELCYILPLPEYTDRVGRPVVVITLREVRRDENGKMDDLKEWSWWALEMIRRTLCEYWVSDSWLEDKGVGRRGKGGEGCVILVNAALAGYRNLEVEMLPTLLAVGHNHFPGIFDAVYVVNAGWTHRSMWGVIKRVLPKSALDKIIFLDKQVDLERVFDLESLPKDLGGTDAMSFETCGNPILKRYSSRPSYGRIPLSLSVPRAESSTSIADVYHTAENTPSSSRRQSLVAGMGLHMSKAQLATRSVVNQSDDTPFATQTEASPIVEPISRQVSRSSTTTDAATGAMQRIKSLSDFHLYLSPSRLAHIDILSDSDSDSDVEAKPEEDMHRPSLSTHKSSIMARRQLQRPPLGIVGNEDARSYSERLQSHHARILEAYRETRDRSSGGETNSASNVLKTSRQIVQEVERPSTPCSPTTPGPPVQISSTAATEPQEGRIQPISAFRSDINPWYGYPAILTGTTVRPRYHRNRNRDLVKTLLFLFILRVQSWRDAFERFLGLNGLGTWRRHRSARYRPGGEGIDPGQGLVDSASASRDVKLANSDRDWIWMAVTFLLLRGTWARILGGPLEALGLGSVRGRLGLI